MSEPTLDAGRAALSRWLLGVTRPVLAPLAASTVFRLVDLLAGLALFGVGVAAVVRFAGDDAPSLWALASTMIGLSLLKAVSRYLEQFLGHLVAFRALELLRREMFARLWPQAPAVMSRSRSGDLLERATKDVDRLEVFFAHTFAPAVTAVLAPAVAVTVIGATVSWPLAGIAAAGLATTLVAVPLFEARLARRAADYTGTLRGRLTHSVTDSVQGLVEVTGYGLQQQRLADAGTIEAELEQVGARAARTAVVRRAAAMAIGFATLLAMVVVGVGAQVDTTLLAAAVAVALRSFDITKGVEDFLVDLDASFASARRLFALTHTPPAVADPAEPQSLPGGPLDIVWHEVGYTYPAEGGGSREAALKGVTAVAPAGLHTCLVGTSGAGKSTLAQLALRYVDPDDGAVTVGGADLRGVGLAELRTAITHVSQRPFLFNDTVAANLRLARPDATDDELREACRQARIHDHVEGLSHGYDTAVGELAGRWSGGQRARLALARALVTRARVFVLDEYTSNLDGELAGEVARSLRAARPEATVVEITHRVASSLEADHVVVLEDGRVVQAGPPSELAAMPGAYAALLERQGVLLA